MFTSCFSEHIWKKVSPSLYSCTLDCPVSGAWGHFRVRLLGLCLTWGRGKKSSSLVLTQAKPHTPPSAFTSKEIDFTKSININTASVVPLVFQANTFSHLKYCCIYNPSVIFVCFFFTVLFFITFLTFWLVVCAGFAEKPLQSFTSLFVSFWYCWFVKIKLYAAGAVHVYLLKRWSYCYRLKCCTAITAVIIKLCEEIACMCAIGTDSPVGSSLKLKKKKVFL